jgi:hypothetical protein
MGSDHGQPSYRLIPTVQTPTIDPGETIEISIFAVGYGEVEKADLYVSFDHPNLIDYENIGRFIQSNAPAWIGNGICVPVLGFVQVFPINNPSYTTLGVRHLFWDHKALRQIEPIMEMEGISFVESFGSHVPDDQFSPIIFHRPSYLTIFEDEVQDDRGRIDDVNEPKPPVKLELKTLPPKSLVSVKSHERTERCNPGDYTITFTLTYGGENEVYQHQTDVSIHVNSWVERHSTVLRVVAVFLAGIAALTALPLIIESLSFLVHELLTFF